MDVYFLPPPLSLYSILLSATNYLRVYTVRVKIYIKLKLILLLRYLVRGKIVTFVILCLYFIKKMVVFWFIILTSTFGCPETSDPRRGTLRTHFHLWRPHYRVQSVRSHCTSSRFANLPGYYDMWYLPLPFDCFHINSVRNVVKHSFLFQKGTCFGDLQRSSVQRYFLIHSFFLSLPLLSVHVSSPSSINVIKSHIQYTRSLFTSCPFLFHSHSSFFNSPRYNFRGDDKTSISEL